MRKRWGCMMVPLLVVGCGGGDPSPDLDATGGGATVDVARASFPRAQNVARTDDLVLAVRNTGDGEAGPIVVTVWTGAAEGTKPQGSFNVRDGGETRPAWLLQAGFPKVREGGRLEPAGAVAAQTDSFTFGTLPAGETRTAVWRVTPVRPGRYTVRYEVAGGIGDGDPVRGRLPVTVDGAPGGVEVYSDRE